MKKFSEMAGTFDKKFFTVEHNSDLLHDVIKGDNLFDTTDMFRTSLVLALLKLDYYIHDSVLAGNMKYDKESHTFTLDYNIFDIEDELDLEAARAVSGLPHLPELKNSQVIKDGIYSMYNAFLSGGIDVELAWKGRVTIEADKITAYFDENDDPFETLLVVTSHFCRDIQLAILAYADALLHDMYAEIC